MVVGGGLLIMANWQIQAAIIELQIVILYFGMMIFGVQ